MSKYITISSDSKFPENSLSNFTTLFENPIYLNEGYEVGVTEIFYPCDFNCYLGEIRLEMETKSTKKRRNF